MKRAILLTVVLAAGCTHTPEPPPEIREVLVPTPVPCVDPADIPPEPPTVGEKFNGDAKHDLQILAPSARALRKWGQDLRALLEACVIEESGTETPGPDVDPGPAVQDDAEPQATEPKPAD